MTSEKIQTILGTDGVPVGVFVPIEVWRELEVKISPAPMTTNGNGAHGATSDVPVQSNKPRLRDRPLTEEELRIKAQYDAIYATTDNRLDPVMAEIQARSILPEDAW